MSLLIIAFIALGVVLAICLVYFLIRGSPEERENRSLRKQYLALDREYQFVKQQNESLTKAKQNITELARVKELTEIRLVLDGKVRALHQVLDLQDRVKILSAEKAEKKTMLADMKQFTPEDRALLKVRIPQRLVEIDRLVAEFKRQIREMLE